MKKFMVDIATFFKSSKGERCNVYYYDEDEDIHNVGGFVTVVNNFSKHFPETFAMWQKIDFELLELLMTIDPGRLTRFADLGFCGRKNVGARSNNANGVTKPRLTDSTKRARSDEELNKAYEQFMLFLTALAKDLAPEDSDNNIYSDPEERIELFPGTLVAGNIVDVGRYSLVNGDDFNLDIHTDKDNCGRDDNAHVFNYSWYKGEVRHSGLAYSRASVTDATVWAGRFEEAVKDIEDYVQGHPKLDDSAALLCHEWSGDDDRCRINPMFDKLVYYL